MVAGGKVLVGLGGNYPGPWGKPADTLARAIEELEARGVRVVAVSDFYQTEALGAARQPPYVNAVALIDTSLPAPALLRVFKQIEARSGRRGGRPWGSRTLDLDLIDYRGLIMNWTRRRRGPQRSRPLILPHPELQRRPFVLRPLLDVAPDWRHPVFKISAQELWRQVPKRGQGSLLKRAA